MEIYVVETSTFASFEPDQVIKFEYKNWRGVKAVRKARVVALTYGSTDWHPEPQWLLKAYDFERGDVRLFAVCDMVPLDAE